jgi:microcystin-dependent protein
MAEPFLSELRIVSFGFAPKGWALCNGQLLPINQNQALFSLLGTTYGGNGQTNFALPNLQAKVPIHVGNGHTLGQTGGENAHTLTMAELPAHTHSIKASSSPGDSVIPTNTTILGSPLNATYRAPDQALAALAPGSLSNIGGSQPHLNDQPFLVLSICIALQGIFPSPN